MCYSCVTHCFVCATCVVLVEAFVRVCACACRVLKFTECMYIYSCTHTHTVFSTVSTGMFEIRQVARYRPLILDCVLPSQNVPYPPRVTWPAVTSQQMNSGRITVTLNGSLVFSAWEQQNDGARFACEVTNPVLGTTQESSSYLLMENGKHSNKQLLPSFFQCYEHNLLLIYRFGPSDSAYANCCPSSPSTNSCCW